MANRDFSEPSIFKLPEKQPNKTIDIGWNGISVSTDALGRILQLSILHPSHGIALSEPFKQFDGDRFYDPGYVRVYRTRTLQHMAENKGGFGLDLGGIVDSVSIKMLNKSSVCFRYTLENNLAVFYVTQILENGEVIQTATVTNNGADPIEHHFNLNLCLSLNRASYGQLTEGGPITLPRSKNAFKTTTHEIFKVTNPYLNAQFEASVEMDGKAMQLESLDSLEAFDEPLNIHARGVFNVKPEETVLVRARMRMTPDINEEGYNLSSTGTPVSRPIDLQSPGWENPQSITTYIIRRNLDYILGTCAIPISRTAVAVLADHVALPLGWNRDNAYAIRFLLEIFNHCDASVMDLRTACQYQEAIKKVATGHLEWVFNVAERPDKFWGRSYLVTGTPKDKSTFQLDQQCYPLLELCDYAEIFEDEDLVKRLVNGDTIKEVLQCLEERRDSRTGLYPTDETPGDDVVENPYHFSSHVLLWRTYTRLRDLCAKVDPSDTDRVKRLDSMADKMRGDTIGSFTTHHPDIGKDVFAYSTDGHGKHEFYHDANDVPTLFAEEWGFTKTPLEVEVWKNTMEFGLSTSNPGFCTGVYGGLGSRHSPGAWVLGYFQQLGYAVRISDKKAAINVWKRITAAMQWDGTFSEAVDSNTAKCSSKAWFAWPGAMIGTLLSQMRANEEHKLWLDDLEQPEA